MDDVSLGQKEFGEVGAILPGHGGMFDRIDALLFAAPVLWAYMAWRVLLQ